MDIKAKVEELVTKIKNDPALLKKFQSDPIKTIETLVGIDLPDEQIKKIVDGVKAKIGVDGAVSLLGKIGKMFGNK